MTDYVRLRRRDPVVIAEGPGPLPRAWRNLSGFDKLSDAELRRHGWYPFRTWPDPIIKPNREKVTHHLEIEDGEVTRRWDVEELTEAERIHRLGERRREILAEIPAIRFRFETGGIVFDGIPLHTDRESQATIALAALQGAGERWKGSDGKWYAMEPERLQAAAQAVMAHKRACFAREEALVAEVKAADSLEALAAIDLEEGWP
ncbi:DUF4376 domain-containing protein [Halomonas sp. ATCH28]|uniref:DUF4376 domain-containing protein n=1 Tax=Halomonas gemina TaxID=2945105 RepID=A0ABT0T334_9GAMM|nr:DUF4376 domain-containing protein [Halomonas gemina]MCL7941222.1 DUF4376 domain-containing protein [Halomonas gemina]